MKANDMIAAAALGGVLMYNQLAMASDHTLLALIVMAAFGGGMIYYVKETMVPSSQVAKALQKQIDAEGRPAGRQETSFPGSMTLPKEFPKKGFKFIAENQVFVEIIEDIRVLKLFDKTRYQDIVLLMDNLQKIYMYILAGRYDPTSYIATFADTKKALIEHFYGMVFSLPSEFKHVYGVDPNDLMKRNIDKIQTTTSTMSYVLKSFATKTAGLPHVPDILESPSPRDTFDKLNSSYLP